SSMTWMGSEQGQRVLTNTTEFVGGWAPTGHAPMTVPAGIGSAGFFIGDPTVLLEEAFSHD
ncbi:MAG: hypothetical protein COS89_05290, partial [Deltaproteobacteria bacterium CG07_land_8_20_14_0_80_38_7]